MNNESEEKEEPTCWQTSFSNFILLQCYSLHSRQPTMTSVCMGVGGGLTSGTLREVVAVVDGTRAVGCLPAWCQNDSCKMCIELKRFFVSKTNTTTTTMTISQGKPVEPKHDDLPFPYCELDTPSAVVPSSNGHKEVVKRKILHTPNIPQKYRWRCSANRFDVSIYTDFPLQ